MELPNPSIEHGKILQCLAWRRFHAGWRFTEWMIPVLELKSALDNALQLIQPLDSRVRRSMLQDFIWLPDVSKLHGQNTPGIESSLINFHL